MSATDGEITDCDPKWVAAIGSGHCTQNGSIYGFVTQKNCIQL